MNDANTENFRTKNTLEEAMKLAEIEGQPLSAEQIEMFKMFDRESWPDDKRLQYILARYKKK